MSRRFLYPLLTLVLAGAACSSQNLWDAAGRVNAKGFRSFALHADRNPQLSADVGGVITGTNIVLYARRPIAMTALVPSFTYDGVAVLVGSNLQQSGISTNDFSVSPVYTVRAIDGTTVDYRVSVDTNAMPNPFATGEYVHFHNRSGDGKVPDNHPLYYLGVRYDQEADTLEFRLAVHLLQNQPGTGTHDAGLQHLGVINGAAFADGLDAVAFAQLADLQPWLVADPAHRIGEVAVWNTRAAMMERLPDGSFRLRVKRSDIVPNAWGPWFAGTLTTKVLFTLGTTLREASTPFYAAPTDFNDGILPWADIPGYPAGGLKVAGSDPTNNSAGVSAMSPVLSLVFFNGTVTTAGTVRITANGALQSGFTTDLVRNRLTIKPPAGFTLPSGTLAITLSGFQAAGGTFPDAVINYQVVAPLMIQAIEVRNYLGATSVNGARTLESMDAGSSLHFYGELDFDNHTGGQPDYGWHSMLQNAVTLAADGSPVERFLSRPLPVMPGKSYHFRVDQGEPVTRPDTWVPNAEDDVFYLGSSPPVPIPGGAGTESKRLIVDLVAKAVIWTNY